MNAGIDDSVEMKRDGRDIGVTVVSSPPSPVKCDADVQAR